MGIFNLLLPLQGRGYSHSLQFYTVWWIIFHHEYVPVLGHITKCRSTNPYVVPQTDPCLLNTLVSLDRLLSHLQIHADDCKEQSVPQVYWNPRYYEFTANAIFSTIIKQCIPQVLPAMDTLHFKG